MCARALLVVHCWRVLVDMQSCHVLCLGVNSCSFTPVQTCVLLLPSVAHFWAARSVCWLTVCWAVLSVVCCSCGVALMHHSCCRLSMTDDQRFPAKRMSASCRDYMVCHLQWHLQLCARESGFLHAVFLQGATMHPSTELHCISVWRLLLQRIHTDCVARCHAVGSRLCGGHLCLCIKCGLCHQHILQACL